MNSRERTERINFFKENMCTICRSKYCKHEIHVTTDNGIITTVCHEYNKTLGRPSKNCVNARN